LGLSRELSPAFKVFAGLEQNPSVVAASKVLTISDVVKIFELPGITAWSAVLGSSFRFSELQSAVSIGRPLTLALESFAVQRVGLSAQIAGLGVQGNLANAQLGQVLSTQNALTRFVVGAGLIKSSSLFDALGRLGQVHAVLGSFADTVHAPWLRGITRIPARRYDSYLERLPAKPNHRRAAVAQFGGDAQSGLLIVESLTTVGVDEDEREEITELYTAEVLEPWADRSGTRARGPSSSTSRSGPRFAGLARRRVGRHRTKRSEGRFQDRQLNR